MAKPTKSCADCYWFNPPADAEIEPRGLCVIPLPKKSPSWLKKTTYFRVLLPSEGTDCPAFDAREGYVQRRIDSYMDRFDKTLERRLAKSVGKRRAAKSVKEQKEKRQARARPG